MSGPSTGIRRRVDQMLLYADDPRRPLGEIIFVDFISDFSGSKAGVVRKDGSPSCPLLHAANHLFLLLPSPDLSASSLFSTIKSQRVLFARSTPFCKFLTPFFSISLLLWRFPNLVVNFGCRPVVHPTFVLPTLGSLPPFSHTWTPITAYKSQPPGVPPEEHRVPFLSNPHHQPPNLNRRENERPIPCNLRSRSRTRFRMIIFQPIATSTLTLLPYHTLPPTLVAQSPSLARTCCFRPWERVSLARSSLAFICNGERKSPSS